MKSLWSEYKWNMDELVQYKIWYSKQVSYSVLSKFFRGSVRKEMDFANLQAKIDIMR